MPKTYKHLYPEICAFENLYRAHRKARRGGKRKRAEVAAFEHGLGEAPNEFEAWYQKHVGNVLTTRTCPNLS